MHEKEVKEKIGRKNWTAFNKWMGGQTTGTYPDGTTDFYECDVNAFIVRLEGGYDRQKDPIARD